VDDETDPGDLPPMHFLTKSLVELHTLLLPEANANETRCR
jgi:hypothetical protein